VVLRGSTATTLPFIFWINPVT